MKTFLQFLALVSGFTLCLAILPGMPTPTPYDPTDNPAQRVREFVRGERDTVNEADLYAPSVPESLRRAALNLAN